MHNKSIRPRDLILNVMLSVIQVRVHDQTTSGGGICSSYNDPHMQTFDGIYWENQRVGEFVMYRHKTKPFSVSGEKIFIPHQKQYFLLFIQQTVHSTKSFYDLFRCTRYFLPVFQAMRLATAGLPLKAAILYMSFEPAQNYRPVTYISLAYHMS